MADIARVTSDMAQASSAVTAAVAAVEEARSRNAVTVALSAIEMDTSIQCRAAIDTGTVNEYAERMTAADKFPPVELFGAAGRYWIGDGWHRIMGARQIGALSIDAITHEGGRREALKFALGANAQHGHRRTNADKRRCVEIALAEFGGLSSRAIAEMCGVGHHLVEESRQLGDSPSSRTSRNGKQYPARRHTTQPESAPMQTVSPSRQHEARPASRAPMAPPALGLQFARMAILDLRQISADDTQRTEAFATVRRWIDENEA